VFGWVGRTAELQLRPGRSRAELVGGPARVLGLVLGVQVGDDADLLMAFALKNITSFVHLFGSLVNERALGRVHQLMAAPEPLDVGLWCSANLALEGGAAAGGAVLVAHGGNNLRRFAARTGQELVVLDQCWFRFASVIDCQHSEAAGESRG
jgi:hypothetical protein